MVSKAGVSFLNFLAMMISARMLGPELRGEASLLIASVHLLMYLCGVLGGPSIINHCQKVDIRRFIKEYYILSALILLVLHGALFWFTHHSSTYILNQLLLTYILSLLTMYQYILTGNNRIKELNISQLLQALFLALVIFIGFKVYPLEGMEYTYFIGASYLSFLVPMLYAAFIVHQSIGIHHPERSTWNLAEYIQSGMVSQLSNIVQFLNYRLVFYILSWMLIDKALVGEYAIAIAISEAIWIIGRSMGLVQLGENVTEHQSVDFKKKKALRLCWISTIISAGVVSILYMIPQEWIQLLVGEKYVYTHQMFTYLIPSTIVFSFQFNLSSFFAAENQYTIANKASIISLVVLVVTGWMLIGELGYKGAAIATALAYISSTLYFYYSFVKYQSA